MSDSLCRLCGEHIPIENVLEHFETEHGITPERWPDGEIVVVDGTLEPDDFSESTR